MNLNDGDKIATVAKVAKEEESETAVGDLEPSEPTAEE
jgi:hypothetical protein